LLVFPQRIFTITLLCNKCWWRHICQWKILRFKKNWVLRIYPSIFKSWNKKLIISLIFFSNKLYSKHSKETPLQKSWLLLTEVQCYQNISFWGILFKTNIWKLEFHKDTVNWHLQSCFHFLLRRNYCLNLLQQNSLPMVHLFVLV
jgi:hypothetical protein